MSKIQVLIKQPGKAAQLQAIDNTLEALQNIVQGYIEAVQLPGGTVMLINEDEHQLDMFRNFDFMGSTIYGPAIFAGIDGERLASVTPEALQDMPA